MWTTKLYKIHSKTGTEQQFGLEIVFCNMQRKETVLPKLGQMNGQTTR